MTENSLEKEHTAGSAPLKKPEDDEEIDEIFDQDFDQIKKQSNQVEANVSALLARLGSNPSSSTDPINSGSANKSESPARPGSSERARAKKGSKYDYAGSVATLQLLDSDSDDDSIVEKVEGMPPQQPQPSYSCAPTALLADDGTVIDQSPTAARRMNLEMGTDGGSPKFKSIATFDV